MKTELITRKKQCITQWLRWKLENRIIIILAKTCFIYNSAWSLFLSYVYYWTLGSVEIIIVCRNKSIQRELITTLSFNDSVYYNLLSYMLWACLYFAKKPFSLASTQPKPYLFHSCHQLLNIEIFVKSKGHRSCCTTALSGKHRPHPCAATIHKTCTVHM